MPTLPDPNGMPPPAGVMRLTLDAVRLDGLLRLDAVRCDDGRVRAFYAAGSSADSFGFTPGTDFPAPIEMRGIAGAVMLVTDGAAIQSEIPLAGGGSDRFVPADADPAIFQGRNVLLGQRLVETPRQTADWIGYHARHHGCDGVVLFSRAAARHHAFARGLDQALTEAGVAVPVVVIDCPVPLGKPGLAPESHPIHAPDAPGKDRMEVPAPDPWLAPLGEGLIFEIAKWRLLTRARAVLSLDVSDILVSAQGPQTAFDRCLASDSGAILLVGQRIYPWRVRPGQEETFGDHICRPFDARRGIARWGVAPEKAGLAKTWRSTRIAYATPDARTVGFWRAMGLRVPGRKASELAPKTALIEDPALIHLAETCFGAKPVRPPVSARREAEGRTCIVTTMKNEGPFILEWIAHHRAIGVEDFLIYSNDCTDGTDRLLEALAARGLVVHRDNPYRESGLKPQHAALQAAETEAVVRDSGWIVCMDVDEYINIRIGDGRLPSLYAAMEGALPGANMVALTWRLFGNADRHDYEDRFVTEQFALCAPELVRKPHQAWGFKTMFRNIDIYKKLGVHRPKGLRPDLWDQVRWLNGSGQPIPREMFRNGWRSTAETYGYDWVALNHYAVRSVESFLVKRDRGRVNHVDRDQGLNYWFRMNHNAVEDLSIQRMLPAVRAEYAGLLADPATRAAHAACIAAHRARIAALRAAPDYAALYAELSGDRMQRLSRMLHVFGASVFNAGPQVIPADLHRADLPAGFLFTVDHAGDAAH